MRYFRGIIFLAVTAAVMLGGNMLAQTSAADPSTGFPPLDQWKSAVFAGDAAGLRAFYSIDPAAQIEAGGVTSGADADINFWLGLKARSMRLEVVRLK